MGYRVTPYTAHALGLSAQTLSASLNSNVVDIREATKVVFDFFLDWAAATDVSCNVKTMWEGDTLWREAVTRAIDVKPNVSS